MLKIVGTHKYRLLMDGLSALVAPIELPMTSQIIAELQESNWWQPEDLKIPNLLFKQQLS